MQKRSFMGAFIALALVATPVLAQGGQGRPGMGAGMRGPAEMQRNPVEVLLDHQQELSLTSEQVAKLETIRDQVKRENGPRWEQMKQAFGDKAPADMTVEERQQARERMQALQPVRDQIRETNRKAMTDARALLTPDQLTRMRGLMRRGPDDRPGRGNRPGRGMHRGPAAPGGPGGQGGPGVA